MLKIPYRFAGVAAATAGLVAGAFALAQPVRTPAGSPVVIELYQSQGCSSCPPANANLNAIADRPDVLPLSFAVTYWDRLGWKDVFARPEYTARQWDYANAAGRKQVATPQMILNGRAAIVGSNRAQLDQAIQQARRTGGPTIASSKGKVVVGGAGGVRPSTVWLVHYDPRVQAVPIRAGENGGRTLPHRNIVRAIRPLGSWSGAAKAFALPASPDPAYRTAVLVQAGKGGPIVAARRL